MNSRETFLRLRWRLDNVVAPALRHGRCDTILVKRYKRAMSYLCDRMDWAERRSAKACNGGHEVDGFSTYARNAAS